MFRGRSRGRGRGGASSGTGRLKGLFADGIWQCECRPRVPAEYFKVKKEGKNQGRWFYTCQKPDAERCGFFLWQEDAVPREKAAVLNNSNDEPRSTPNAVQDRHNARRQRTPTISPPPPSRPRPTLAPSNTRTDNASDVFDLDDSWPLNEEEEARITKIAEASTPQKSTRTSAFMTPGKRKLSDFEETHGSGLPTPDTRSVKRPAFTPAGLRTVSTSMSQGSGSSAIDKFGSLSPAVTPTPKRFKGAPNDSVDDLPLVKDVSEVLEKHDVHLHPEAAEELKQILKSYDLRIQQITKGRETSRLALRAKEAKIAELEHRLVAREAEFTAQNAVISQLRWEEEAFGNG